MNLNTKIKEEKVKKKVDWVFLVYILMFALINYILVIKLDEKLFVYGGIFALLGLAIVCNMLANKVLGVGLKVGTTSFVLGLWCLSLLGSLFVCGMFRKLDASDSLGIIFVSFLVVAILFLFSPLFSRNPKGRIK